MVLSRVHPSVFTVDIISFAPHHFPLLYREQSYPKGRHISRLFGCFCLSPRVGSTQSSSTNLPGCCRGNSPGQAFLIRFHPTLTSSAFFCRPRGWQVHPVGDLQKEENTVSRAPFVRLRSVDWGGRTAGSVEDRLKGGWRGPGNGQRVRERNENIHSIEHIGTGDRTGVAMPTNYHLRPYASL